MQRFEPGSVRPGLGVPCRILVWETLEGVLQISRISLGLAGKEVKEAGDFSSQLESQHCPQGLLSPERLFQHDAS